MRNPRLVSTLAAICAASSMTISAEDVLTIDRPYQSVAGNQIEPFGNITAADGAYEIHLVGQLGLGMDSNVYEAPSNEVSSAFVHGLAGFRSSYNASEVLRLDLDLDFNVRTYADSDASDRDWWGGLLSGRAAYITETTKTTGEVFWHRFIDPTIETGRSIDAQNIGAKGNYAIIGLTSDYSIGLDLLMIDYLEDGVTFNQDDRDRIEYGIPFTYTYHQNSQTEWGGKAALQGSSYSDGGDNGTGGTLYQDGIGLRLAGFWHREFNEQMRFRAELGIDYRTYSDSFAENDDYDDDTSIWPVGEIAFDFAFQEDLGVLSASIKSDVSDGSSSNSVRVLNLNLNGAHSFYPDSGWEAFAVISWFNRVGSGAPAGQSEGESDTYAAQLGATYEFRQGMAIRGLAAYRTNENANNSNLDYDKTEFSVDFLIAY